jgi:hypothetical protein
MAGRTAQRWALEYNAESSASAWCEASTTYGSRLAVLGDYDVSGLTQSKDEPERATQYAQEGTMPIRGVKGGSYNFDLWCPGHGSATDSGTPSVEEHETLMGVALGAVAAGGAATTASAGTTTITTAAASGLTAGQIFWGGVKGDGRMDGQAGVVSTHSSSTLTSLTAVPAAASGTDAIASSVMVYFNETVSSLAVANYRMRLLTADQQYAMRGMWPSSWALTGLNPGEKPRMSFGFGVSDWDPVSATFPSSTAVDSFNPAANAGGSLFFQARGTATRQTYVCRSFDLSIDLGVQPVMGPGGVGANQVVVGAVRGPAQITATFTIDSESATASPTWPGRWDSDTQFYHLLLNLNGAVSGKRVALYMPNCCITDRKPVQVGQNGINRETITVRAYMGTDTTSELTRSAFRIGLG